MKYTENDMMTCYFVIKDVPGKRPIVKAWSTDKGLVSFYMKFHKHPHFIVKEETSVARDMFRIMDQYSNDQIAVTNIETLSSNKKGMDLISIPMTDNELDVVTDETNDFVKRYINYSIIDKFYHLIKPKYRQIFDDIFLSDITKYIVYRKKSNSIDHIHVDKLSVFIKTHEDDFG